MAPQRLVVVAVAVVTTMQLAIVAEARAAAE